MQNLTSNNLEEYLDNVIKVFHLILHHSELRIGSPLLQEFHHRARKIAREFIKSNSEDVSEEQKKDLKEFHDLIKACYNCYSEGDIIGAETYYYHLRSIAGKYIEI